MSKAAKMVAAIVTTAAAAVFGGPILGAIATVAQLSALDAYTTPKLPTTSSGDESRWKADPRAGVPYAVGRCAIAGDIRFEKSAPVSGSNKFKNFVTVYSVGPIDGFEGFYANNNRVDFTADQGEGASGYYKNRMWMRTQLGQANEPYLRWTATGTKDTPADHGGLPTEWTAAHRLSGYAASLWGLEFDTNKYAGGVPPPKMVGRWVKVYDPRKDSTYPGGIGPHRYANPSNKAAYLAAKATWEWSADPNLHGLMWGLGTWTGDPDHPVLPLVQTHGLGFDIEDIDVASFVEAANVSRANAWTLGGRVYSTDDKWEVLKSFLQAGGAEPVLLGDRLACVVNSPKVSMATVTGADTAGEVSLDAAVPFNERLNTIWPSWTVEELAWEVTPAGAPVQVAEYVAVDKGERSKEMNLPLVQSGVQAGQLARYMIEDSRELPNIVIPLKPEWMWLEPGECITANEPAWGLNGQKLSIRRRVRDPATMVVTLICRTETDAKHPYALGQSATPGGGGALTGVDPNVVPLPAEDAWAIVEGFVAGESGSLPAIVIGGGADLYEAVSIVVDYRKVLGGGEYGAWQSESFPASTTTLVVKGVEAGARYQVRVRYITARGVENPDAGLDLGEVDTGGVDAGTVQGKSPMQIAAEAQTALQPALDAIEATAQAAALEAGEATAALFTPGTGVVSRVDGLKTQADGLAASLSSEIALRIAGDAASAGRLDQVEAKFRSLPNLIRNGDGSASQASDPLKDWNEIGARGFAYAGTSSAVGAHWYLAANTSGAVRYFVTDWYGVDPSMPVSASASGETFGAAGANRSQIYLDWGLGGASVGGSAHVFLDATNLDWLSKRAQLIATAPASGANQMRFVVSQPPGSPGLYITRVMVNYGGAPLPFNDLLTERETRTRVTQTELAQAASDSSLAALTNRVGVSMQQGSSQVRNAYFGAYTNAAGLADGWNDWAGGSTAVRVDGAAANFAARFTVPVGTDRGFAQPFTLAPGRYTMLFEGYCRAGNWGGAGLFIHRQGDGAIVAFIDCDNDPDDAGVTGVGGVGYRRYSKTFDLATTTAVSLFAMAGWTGFGPVIAKTLDIWACDVYPVDAVVRQAQADATTALTGNATLSASFASAQTATNARFTSPTGEVQVAKSQAISESLANTNLAVSNLRQSVSTSAGDLVATAGAAFTAASDAEAKLAVGRIELIAAGGSGVPAKMAIVSDSAGGSAIQLSAGQIGFGDNTTFDDATDTTRTVTNGVATVIAWGASFGGDLGGATLREWMGPASVALSAMTRANAYSYRADTLPYAGGSAVSGVDGALMKIGSGTAGGVSSSSFVDILVLPFSSIPAAGYWSVGADFYAGQTSSPTQSTASGVARLVERKAGFSDVALTGDVPWSVAWQAGDLAYESTPAQPVNAGIASTYTGAVSIVLQARKTGGPAVGGAALNYQARATWTKAG